MSSGDFENSGAFSPGGRSSPVDPAPGEHPAGASVPDSDSMPVQRRGTVRVRVAVALAVFWCLLWRDLSLGNVVNGILLGLLVQIAFPLPRLSHELAFRPIAGVRALLIFAFDVTKASFEVGWIAIRPRPVPASSVIAVELRARSDFFLTLTGITVSLVPGSLVIEAQRSSGTLFLHVLGATNETEVESFRHSVLAQEERLLRGFGSAEALRDAGLT